MTSENAQRLVDVLHSEGYNQTEQARAVAGQLNQFIGAMNAKLALNNFQALNNWEGRGVGDTTVAAKYRFVDEALNKFAVTAGVVAPTGRVDDPDHLIDIPFGTGAWAGFSSFIADQYLTNDLFLNQYAKFTYLAPARKEIRLKTSDEAIEVDKRGFLSIGSQIDMGASAQYEPSNGAVAGVGYVFSAKNSIAMIFKKTQNPRMPGKPEPLHERVMLKQLSATLRYHLSNVVKPKCRIL